MEEGEKLYILHTIYAQTVSRFQNPWINVVRRHACSIVECNIGEVCDLSYDNCRPTGPCLLKQPTCVSAFNSARPGRCPSPRLNLIPRFTVDCFDDPGCDASQICCHNYFGSYCFPLNRRRTGSLLQSRMSRIRNG
ncbi:uncharacterized protein LOC134282068 isoform X2 [Saccostrea cucullata]|uniref:uncharacterized protein LOC134282068 isoform X2 n=1 Tax=Saccostrea cuccullata TaxID=36930 RepID=UPI002ED477D9